MRVFLTGGSGQIGRAIAIALLERGDEVVVVTRNAARAKERLPGEVELVEADPCYDSDPWQQKLWGCDAAISLAGEPIMGQRWDARFRQVIHDSRIDSTRFLAEGIVKCPIEQRPKVLVATSGMDYYGFAEIPMFDDDELAEDATGGESFLSYLCWDWEDETKICSEAGVAVTHMRLGMVLGPEGALPALCAPFRKGFGGPIGRGRQWTSWVHIADVVRAYLFALDSQLEGPCNLVAPDNVRQERFANTLGEVLGHRSWFRARPLWVRARLGEVSKYILKGRRLVPKALLDKGFTFAHPDLRPALVDLLK